MTISFSTKTLLLGVSLLVVFVTTVRLSYALQKKKYSFKIHYKEWEHLCVCKFRFNFSLHEFYIAIDQQVAVVYVLT